MISLFVACFLLLFLAFPLASAAAPSQKKPNVLLICVDDLKPLLGCYGDKKAVTPNIDRFARRSVLFERAYCNQAVCAPSRNSLMTGVRPTTLGIYDLGTNFRAGASNAVTLTQYFMRHGYRAEGLGKIFHVGHGNHEDPASWSVPHLPFQSIAYVLSESRARQGLTREEALFANESAANLPRGAAYESADVPDEAYPDGRLATAAISRLRAARGRSEPFFMAVGFVKPHLPFCAPKRYWDLYQRESFVPPALQTPPDGAPRYAPTTWGEVRQYTGMPERGPLDLEQARTLIHGYYAATSFVDAQIGRVLEELHDLGLDRQTIVVLWGDHGWHLGDHGMWSKHTNYEEANRIPLLISAPGVTRGGKRTQSLAETIDLYPTLCELAGLPQPDLPQKLEGTSLVPVLKRPSRELKDAVFQVFPRNRPGDGQILGRAVRTGRYRMVEWKKPGAPATTAEYELYDYKKDPRETRNFAATESETLKMLQTILARLPEANPQISAPRNRPAVDRAALFQRKDRNGDGTLTRNEFLAGQPDPRQAPARFLRFDTDKNGLLTRDEFIRAGND